MKYFILTSIKQIAIAWAMVIPAGLIFVGIFNAFGLFMFWAFSLIILWPIYIIYTQNRLYKFKKWLSEKQLDLRLTFPVFCYFGAYRLDVENPVIIDKSNKIRYCLCLVSKERLHIFECKKSLLLKGDYERSILKNFGDFDEAICTIKQSQITEVTYMETPISSDTKKQDWATDRFMDLFGSVYDSSVSYERVRMGAFVELVVTDKRPFCYTFGIPGDMSNSNEPEFDIEKFIPEGANPIPDFVPPVFGVLGALNELGEIFEEERSTDKKESMSLVIARQLANHIVKLANEA